MQEYKRPSASRLRGLPAFPPPRLRNKFSLTSLPRLKLKLLRTCSSKLVLSPQTHLYHTVIYPASYFPGRAWLSISLAPALDLTFAPTNVSRGARVFPLKLDVSRRAVSFVRHEYGDAVLHFRSWRDAGDNLAPSAVLCFPHRSPFGGKAKEDKSGEGRALGRRILLCIEKMIHFIGATTL